MKAIGACSSRILARTRERVAERRRERPLDRCSALVAQASGHRALRARARAGPASVNVIARVQAPLALARRSARGPRTPPRSRRPTRSAGAAALSVLTEEQFFGGSVEDLQEARAGHPAADAAQGLHRRSRTRCGKRCYIGADAVLLIVAALDDASSAPALDAAVQDAGLEALVEVHDRDELERALAAGARIVGVNNRDLRTLDVRPADVARRSATHIPDDVVAVAESGIARAGDIRRLRDAGFDAFLIGEHLMLADDPGAALEQLLDGCAVAALVRARPRGSGRVAVKICGITNVGGRADGGAARARTRSGSSSGRRARAPWTLATARDIAATLPPFVLRVGVFVDATPRRDRRASRTRSASTWCSSTASEPPEAVARAAAPRGQGGARRRRASSRRGRAALRRRRRPASCSTRG